VPLTGYPASAWLALIGLTVGRSCSAIRCSTSPPQGLGDHGSVVICSRVRGYPGCLGLARASCPASSSVPGLALLLAGVALVIFAVRDPGDTPVLEEPEANVSPTDRC